MILDDEDDGVQPSDLEREVQVVKVSLAAGDGVVQVQRIKKDRYSKKETIVAEKTKELTALDLLELVPTKLEEPHARVCVQHAATINMGNYNSLKVSIMLAVPCRVDSIDKCCDRLMEMISKRMEKEVVEARTEASS